MDDSTQRMVMMTIVVSLIFPIFTYTFMNFTDTLPSIVDVSLDTESLLNQGIILKDGESHNVTYNDPATQFDFANHSLRVRWYDRLVWGDVFEPRRQSWIEQQLGTWFAPNILSWTLDGTLYPAQNMHNQTVLVGWDADYNWTLLKIPEDGSLCFITTLESDDNNITKAILETGTVTITLGTQAGTSFNFGGFVDWYWSILVTGNDFGLPAFMGWLIKILSAYMVLGALLLGRELLPT